VKQPLGWLQRFAVAFGIEHDCGQVELLGEFQCPLLADGYRADDQQGAFSLRPALAEHDSCLNKTED
jgi:hypothetical protein